jgi:hypothetical protein
MSRRWEIGVFYISAGCRNSDTSIHRNRSDAHPAVDCAYVEAICVRSAARRSSSVTRQKFMCCKERDKGIAVGTTLYTMRSPSFLPTATRMSTLGMDGTGLQAAPQSW